MVASSELRVFAVDDQLAFLNAAASVIAATDGFRLVGCASSGQSAVDRLAEIADDVDLVLLDIELGDGRGTDVAERLLEQSPDLAIAFLSMLEEEDLLDEIADGGAIAFLPKPAFGPAALLALIPQIERQRLP